MQDQQTQISGQSKDATAVAEEMAAKAEQAVPGMEGTGDVLAQVIEKIKGAENILVTLSRDPAVDEMAGAIGLTMFLDSLQKHATAIYSGRTPDALRFLRPEGTFETNTASLQDFIIALNKEKADHLRYKLEGDFVKIYITPYKTTLSEADLEFSHGDYNVDLVLALAVPSAGDLDAALAEYGRIMHNATTIDITAGAPGRFGEIEWSEPGASSVCEMLTRLIFQMQGEATLDKEIANALLTGIVAATGRFSNERTNAETMQIASRLMEMGADQQMIASHVLESETEAKVAAEQEREAEEKAKVAAEAEAAAKAAEMVSTAAGGTMVAVDQKVLEEARARAAAATAATTAVNQAVASATQNAAAVGATGQGLVAEPQSEAKPALGAEPTATTTAQIVPEREVPVLPTVQPVTGGVVAPVGVVPVASGAPVTVPASAPVAQGVSVAPMSTAAPTGMNLQPTGELTTPTPVPEPKNYEAMIEQALAEPLPVETAASAAGLLKTPIVTPAEVNPVAGVEAPSPVAGVEAPSPVTGPVAMGVNPAVTAAPMEAAEPAVPITGVVSMPTAPATPVMPVIPNAVPETAVTANATPEATGAANVASDATVVPNAVPEVAAVTNAVPVMPPVAQMTAAQPTQTILPPAPTPEVGTGMMPPTGTLMTESPAGVGVANPTGVPMTTPPTGAPMTTPSTGVPMAEPTTGASAAGAPGAFQIPGA